MFQRTLALALLMISLAGGGTASDSLPRNVLRVPTPFELDARLHEPDIVVLKIAEGVRARLRESELVALDAVHSTALRDVGALLSGTVVTRYFRRSEEDLDEERDRALGHVRPGWPEPADLNNYYRLTTQGPAHTAALIDALNALAIVETALPELRLSALVPSADIAPPTPIFESQQNYLAAAPGGLGYDPMRSIVGVRGQGISVAHLGADWYFGHEDAVDLNLVNLVGATPSPVWSTWRDHETACVGILHADRNRYGVRGMSNGADFFVASFESGIANMVSLATAQAGAGDVFSSSFGWDITQGQAVIEAPLDYDQTTFDAIYTASLLGITYVVSAGNSNQDLADTTIFGTRYTSTADSGAIIVGASRGSTLDKAAFSNYGLRVDCQGWGGGVTTLGYGHLFFGGFDVRQSYTDQFGGTSAAAPQIAGVAAAISATVNEQDGVQLTPWEIRDLVSTYGTPQGAGAPIGIRPDLVQILGARNLPDGLLLTVEPTLGGSYTLDVTGPPGHAYGLLFSLGRSTVDLGFNRSLLIDPLSMRVFTGGTLPMGVPPAVTQQISGGVPPDGTLEGMQLFMQAVVWDAATFALHLTNSVEFYVP